MERVGALHLGRDVVSVAAGGGAVPIRPVRVEGSYAPPAYLLADASGRLHTAGGQPPRTDLGLAITDIRDIIGHPRIVVAGATWPAELVFRARLHNPLAAISEHLRSQPRVVALPFPDGWPDARVDAYCALIEQLGVATEPLPESVALSGYARALGWVSPPDQYSAGVGATMVYSEGQSLLVVAVHGDEEQPTESVEVALAPEATQDARAADNAIIEAMAGARSMGADTSTVVLTGQACFNDPLRLAFQNHLGHRMRKAPHPLHALVLGAVHLVVHDGDPDDYAGPAGPGPTHPPAPPSAPPPMNQVARPLHPGLR